MPWVSSSFGSTIKNPLFSSIWSHHNIKHRHFYCLCSLVWNVYSLDWEQHHRISLYLWLSSCLFVYCSFSFYVSLICSCDMKWNAFRYKHQSKMSKDDGFLLIHWDSGYFSVDASALTLLRVLGHLLTATSDFRTSHFYFVYRFSWTIAKFHYEVSMHVMKSVEFRFHCNFTMSWDKKRAKLDNCTHTI